MPSGCRRCMGVRGALGAGMECRYSGASRGIGGIRGLLEGVGDVGGVGDVRGQLGCMGCIGGGRWTGSPTTLGPGPGSHHSHWFPLGRDLPAKAKQVTEMSSAGYYIHLELYLVTACTFVSMPPHHISLHIM